MIIIQLISFNNRNCYLPIKSNITGYISSSEYKKKIKEVIEQEFQLLIGFVLLNHWFSVYCFVDHVLSFFIWLLHCVVCSSSDYLFCIFKLFFLAKENYKLSKVYLEYVIYIYLQSHWFHMSINWQLNK